MSMLEISWSMTVPGLMPGPVRVAVKAVSAQTPSLPQRKRGTDPGQRMALECQFRTGAFFRLRIARHGWSVTPFIEWSSNGRAWLQARHG